MVDDGQDTVASGNDGPLGANVADEAMVLSRKVIVLGVGNDIFLITSMRF